MPNLTTAPRLLLRLVLLAVLPAAGCVLDWSGDPPLPPVDAAPDHALPDAPLPDLDASRERDPDLPYFDVLDAFQAPGPFKTIKAGTFTMGSPITEPCRPAPQDGGAPLFAESKHEVTLTHDFEINIYELKRWQFEAVMQYDPSYYGHSAYPVHYISWQEAAAYCNAVSFRLGLAQCYQNVGSATYCNTYHGDCPQGEQCNLVLHECSRFVPHAVYSGSAIYTCPGYRLPTEAEWEYAYRAETTSGLYNGKEATTTACGACSVQDPGLDPIAWFCGNSYAKVRPGGLKQPNAWGLYDMAGNFNELCHDGFVQDLGTAAQTDPAHDPPLALGEMVIRGGSVADAAGKARASARAYLQPTAYEYNVSMRCVRTVQASDGGP